MRLDSYQESVLWRRIVFALPLLLALGACGSTLQPDAMARGLGSSDPALGIPGEASGSVPGTSSNAPSSTGAVGLGGSGQGSLPGSSGSVALPAPKTSGPGYTAKEIFIGVAYDSTFSQELGAAGVSSGNATVGDQKQQVNAIVRDINTRGGVAGRKLVPIFYDTKGLNSQNDANTIAQAACSAWTEDKRVFAAMTYVVQMDNEVLYSCLASHGVIFVALGGESTRAFTKYSPYLWSPAGVTPERLVPVWITRLAALGYFSGWNTSLGQPGNAPLKIGLLYGNGTRNGQPELDVSFVQAVKKALARQGRAVAEEFEITNNQADEAAAVLRFKNAKVTHVIGDYSIVNFTQPAESQIYRPRYGYTSFGGGVALKLFAPPAQLRGALGIGFAPALDVENAQDPGDVSPAATHCRKIMQAAGQPTSSRLGWFAMAWACDTFNFFAGAIPRSGLSASLFKQAAAGIGSMPPSLTFSIAFPNGRPDGVGVVRDVGYRTECSCFVYLSSRNHGI